MTIGTYLSDAVTMATSVRAGRLLARDMVETALARIGRLDPLINCVTSLLAERARATAIRIDAAVAKGSDPGPLAGVPFGVKNLFDIAGLTTLAGSKILRERPPATDDASVIKHLEAAGAILIGALNMDEFAYGFSTENEHYGVTRNPHDLTRIAGGSSGGSAAAVAAHMVPVALGSDTNGSVRVPAALCGVFGMKPTFGRLSRSGAHAFVSSLDHVGLFAGSVRDLAVTYDAMQGADPTDPALAERAPEPVYPTLDGDTNDLRVASLGGWFEEHAGPGVLEAVARVVRAIQTSERIVIPRTDVARSAAACITAAEAAARHLVNLRSRQQDFDHSTRYRLIAGLAMPAVVTLHAQRIRRWYRDQVLRLFDDHDLFIAPATICAAPRIGEATVRHGGQALPVRANLGLYTQPFSFIGLPVVTVPVIGAGMPIGVQIIAPPWREDLALRLATRLERLGVVACHPFTEPPADVQSVPPATLGNAS